MPIIIKDNWLPMLVAALMGAGGGVGGLQVMNPRPDPFTGSQGMALEVTLKRYIDDKTNTALIEHKLEELYRNSMLIHEHLSKIEDASSINKQDIIRCQSQLESLD